MDPVKRRALWVYTWFERCIVLALLFLLMIIVSWGTALLASEIFHRVAGRMMGEPPLTGVAAREFFERLGILHEAFGAFLLILIGLELMKTVVMYLDQHELHVEVVFTVAMIAIARHAIDLNLTETPPLVLVGMGVLILALSLGHYFFRKTVDLVNRDGQGSSDR